MNRPFPTSASHALKTQYGSNVYWLAWVGAGRPAVALHLAPASKAAGAP